MTNRRNRPAERCAANLRQPRSTVHLCQTPGMTSSLHDAGFDASEVDHARTALIEIVHRLPGVQIEPSHGHTGFLVRGKRFAWLLVDHHGDSRLAVWIKAPSGEQATLVQRDDRRYFAPPYLGPKGWVGALVDGASSPDWQEIDSLMEQAWRMSATKAAIAAYESGGAVSANRATRIGTTEADVRRLALALPDTTEASPYGTPGFRVHGKLFARLREDGQLVVWVRDLGEKEALLASDGTKFGTTPHYQGHASVLVALPAIGADELGELLTDAWLVRAPARLRRAHRELSPPSQD